MGQDDDILDCRKHGRIYEKDVGCVDCFRAALRYVVRYILPDGEVREGFEAALRGEPGAVDFIDEEDLARPRP